MEGGGLATMDLTDGNRGSKPSAGSISPNLRLHLQLDNLLYLEMYNSALAANTVVGRLLEEAMLEHMVELMVELTVELMVVAINECLRILFPFPTTKRRTSGVTVSR